MSVYFSFESGSQQMTGLNKSVFKGRGDECVSAALSISVTMPSDSQWCGEGDSAGILIHQ